MARTKAANLNRDTVQADLRDAEAALADLTAKIAEGSNVTAEQLGEAEHQVNLAEKRLAAVGDHEARQAEQHRLDQIEQIRASLTSGEMQHKANELLAALDDTTDAIARLVSQADGLRTVIDAAARKLSRLGDLPEGLRLSGSVNPKIVVERTRWHVPDTDRLLAEAVIKAIDQAGAGKLNGPLAREHSSRAGRTRSLRHGKRDRVWAADPLRAAIVNEPVTTHQTGNTPNGKEGTHDARS